MPRDGSGVYSKPFPDVVTNTAISSTVYNGNATDIVNDLNNPRPIVAGGTGASSAAAAMAALKGEQYDQVVTNYDSHVFLPGTFYSASTATAEPVDGHAFVGMCAYVDANNMFLQAFDRDDTAQPGALWTRQKKAGVWSSWVKSAAINISGTPAANSFTTWQSSTALQGVAITGLVKGNGASAPTAAVAGTDYMAATGANPTASVGLSAVNGSATTAMRSDAAPALSQAIVPTWSGIHTFSAVPVFSAGIGAATATTPSAGDSSTKVATTAFVTAVDITKVATVKIQKFTASGTYTPSTGMLYCIIEAIGGGGGGGGVLTAVGSSNSGGGGGSGGYSRSIKTAAAVGASQTVTIGGGGAGGVGNGAGSAGGTTSVGALCIALGGGGGNQGNLGAVPNPGAGGASGTGDLAAVGAPGVGGTYAVGGTTGVLGVSGSGGSSYLGGGGTGAGPTSGGIVSGVAGVPGTGSGGSGAASHNNASSANGGAGGSGLVIITEFCNQ